MHLFTCLHLHKLLQVHLLVDKSCSPKLTFKEVVCGTQFLKCPKNSSLSFPSDIRQEISVEIIERKIQLVF